MKELKNDYKYQKELARDFIQRILYPAACRPGISWGELISINEQIERVARRYGLLRELRENGAI